MSLRCHLRGHSWSETTLDNHPVVHKRCQRCAATQANWRAEV